MENSYQETIIRFKAYKELADDISKLQKALDKACEFLEKGYGNEYVDDVIHMTKEHWKEWLLKDED